MRIYICINMHTYTFVYRRRLRWQSWISSPNKSTRSCFSPAISASWMSFLLFASTRCCRVLQGVAVCCSVLQCVTCVRRLSISNKVLQCVAVCCSVLQYIAVRCSVLHCVICVRRLSISNTVLQCVASRCRELQYIALCCSVALCHLCETTIYRQYGVAVCCSVL